MFVGPFGTGDAKLKKGARKNRKPCCFAPLLYPETCFRDVYVPEWTSGLQFYTLEIPGIQEVRREVTFNKIFVAHQTLVERHGRF